MYRVDFWSDELEIWVKGVYSFKNAAEAVVEYLESRNMTYKKSF